MPETQALLHRCDLWNELRREGAPTGLADLDDLTRGLLPGTLWVVAGAPGVGKSMLLAQLARVAATAGASTRFISGREDRRLIISYWLAAEARVPLHYLLGGRLEQEHVERLQLARERLQTAPLAVWTEDDDEWIDDICHSTASFRHQIGGLVQRARLLAVDDVDLLLDAPLHEHIGSLRRWTRRANFTLVVSVPTCEVFDHQENLQPVVGRESDVLLLLTRERLDAGPRAGEADLTVMRNRYGPVGRITVHFQGFYATFVCP